MKVELRRVYLETETLGSIYIDDHMICKTMELPWRNNRKVISCIPEGLYKVIKQLPKAGRDYHYFRLPNVPGRSGILIHRVTFVDQLKGCIGVGEFYDLNNDRVPDMIKSSKTLKLLVDILPDEFDLIITKKI